MLNSHRREHILNKLSKKNRISISEMVVELSVSDETIRRDLKDLEAEGLLRRVHGGAIAIRSTHDEPIETRSFKASKQKALIAKLASDLITDNMSIFLDTGTTTLSLARQLSKFSDLKLYTNSLNVAEVARHFYGVSVFVVPGHLRQVEKDLVGYDTIEYISNYYFDLAFMGTAGVDLSRGFMDFEEDESRIRQALLKNSKVSVMLADNSKFGKTANMSTASFNEIDHLITNKKPPTEFIEVFGQSQIEVTYS